jgi:RNA polymerase sigma factor (sigma-70 family)
MKTGEASEAAGVAQRIRLRRFEQQCDRLRPLGEAFVMRRFSGQLNREDAEDTVSEVVIRLYERAAAGQFPDNARAVFFTSVRNRAIDLLRARGARPSEVELEAASAAETGQPGPEEQAASREEAAVLREAMGRMRSNYREAILLRFGVGMTVPEIAGQKGISLPAAKKLVLNATAQVKDKLLTVTSPEHCDEMQEFGRRRLFEKYATDLATDEEAALLRRHLEHCGHCKSFMAGLTQNLHELASGALVSATAADQLTDRAGIAGHVGNWIGGAQDHAHALSEKARFAALRVSDALPGSDPVASGALAGTGAKIAAVCGAGAATAATCLATGVVGPGITVGHGRPVEEPPARVQAIPDQTTTPTTATVTGEPSTTTQIVQPPPEQTTTPEKPVQRVNNEIYGGGSTAASSGSTSGTRDFASPTGGGSSGGGGGSGSREAFGP